MSDTVIRVENLGKKYTIGQQQQERYTALRDVIADGAKGFSKRFRHLKGKGRGSASKDFWALKDVSFDINQGDRVGIVGRNGAGKSTLLKVISRITEPTTGRIRINGRVASLLEVGTGFHPELTGRENIFLNGAILGMRKAEIHRKFDEIVAFAEVEKFLDTPVKRYSSGMYVRLAFAVAAHLEPEILVVDEVLAVGDVAFQRKCLGKMREVSKEGRTIFFVSHNMAALRSLCENAYWFEKGCLREIGLVNDIVDLYEKENIYQAGSSSASGIFANEARGIEIHCVNAYIRDDDTTKLRIEIQGLASQKISRMGVCIQLTTSDGILVSKIWPSMINAFLEDVSGSWQCVFEYPDINRHLAAGDYIIGVILNKPKSDALLIAENAALVSIPPLDVYNSGNYFYLRQHGIAPLPVNFIF